MRLLHLRTVLVATDLEGSSRPAVIAADALARAAGAALHVMYAISPADGGNAALSAGVQAVKGELEHVGVAPAHADVHVMAAPAARAIRNLARRIDADVIVLGPHGTRGTDAERDGLGSTAYAVASGAPVPCLVVPHSLTLPLRRVLVAVDLSETARGALAVALRWGSALRARRADDHVTTLTALHVAGVHQQQHGAANASRDIGDELEVVRREAGGWAGVNVEGITIDDTDVARRIGEEAVARRVDLVVLGTRGLASDASDRLGSVSAALIRMLRVPVLLVPPAVWHESRATQSEEAGAR